MKMSAAILATFLVAQPVVAHAAWVTKCEAVDPGVYWKDITGRLYPILGTAQCIKLVRVWDSNVSEKDQAADHAAWERQQRENDRIQKDNFDNCCGKGRSYGHDFGQP